MSGACSCACCGGGDGDGGGCGVSGCCAAVSSVRLAESWSFACIVLLGGGTATLWVVWDLGFL
jgi:hypothetical protein